jgi:hypothetical protein
MARRELKQKTSTPLEKQTLTAAKLTRKQFRLLGILPLAFFSAQAIHYCQIQQLGHMLWMCNIGNFLLAIGLFFENATLVRVAVIWMVPGVAVWFAYVVPTWGMLLNGKFTYAELFGVVASTLAHLGGIAVGLFILRTVKVIGGAWLYAFAWYFVIQVFSRLFTPAALNVNLSHNIYPGWEQTFNNYWTFWLVLSSLVGVCLWLINVLLKALWPVSADSKTPLPSDPAAA